jgi:hypothetical protein
MWIAFLIKRNRYRLLKIPIAPVGKSAMILLTDTPHLGHVPVHPQRREYEKDLVAFPILPG